MIVLSSEVSAFKQTDEIEYPLSDVSLAYLNDDDGFTSVDVAMTFCCRCVFAITEDDDVVVITIKSEELFDVEFCVESRFDDD